jgi:predicted RNase H-like HicB family nuclease
LDELVANLHEVLALCLEEEAAQGGTAEPTDHFVGVQRIAVTL